MKNWITKAGVAIGCALLTGAVAFATPAQAQLDQLDQDPSGLEDPAYEHGTLSFSQAGTDKCGEVKLTFHNPTPWLFVFDVRIDDQDPLYDPVASGTIGEGPLEGQEFGPRWNLVEVDGSAGVHEATVVYEFDSSAEIRAAEGAEQKLYFDWQQVNVSELACPDPEPTATPTSSVAPSESPGEVCVDVNTAGLEELVQLRHVDAERAEQILDLRPFDSVNDLDQVDGLAAGGPRLAELATGGDGHPPLCDFDSGSGGDLPDTTSGLGGVLRLGGLGVAFLTFGGVAIWIWKRKLVA